MEKPFLAVKCEWLDCENIFFSLAKKGTKSFISICLTHEEVFYLKFLWSKTKLNIKYHIIIIWIFFLESNTFLFSYHIYVNILHNTVEEESSRCVLRAPVFILNHHNLEQEDSKKFFSFLLSAVFVFANISESFTRSKICSLSYSSSPKNEWTTWEFNMRPTLSVERPQRKLNKNFLFLSRSLVISDNIRNGIKMLPLHTLRSEQMKSFAFFSSSNE